jgi:endopeptidase Clp ATP-binding regulatory subunit ClpX
MKEIKEQGTSSPERGQKIPTQKELEREISEYLSRKYGDRVKIFTSLVFPKEENEGLEREKEPPKGAASKIRFDLKPEELEAYLDEYVIRQDEAKAVLATKICTHFNRIKYWEQQDKAQGHDAVGTIKNNILMIGPTGVGKTYLIKLIAKKLGVPFVKGDATKFSETGYVGGDVEDLVRDLVYEAGDDIELAQYGIIYIDEIDKIASSGNIIGPDVSRTGVQRALLKPMEETEVDLKVPHDPVSQIQAIENYRKTGKKEKRTINTRHILFIVSGAFNNLDKIIQKRVQDKAMGFGANVRSKKTGSPWLSQVRAEDLIAYGFESEFVGRLPVVVVLEELTEEDLYQILKNPNNPIIRSKKRDFKAYGIDILFEDEALRLLARNAAKEKTGARGLVSVVEKALIKFEKKLPSTDIRRFLVTPEVVEDPERELNRLLQDPDHPDWKERFDRARRKEEDDLVERIHRKKGDLEGRGVGEWTEYRLRLIARHCLDKIMDFPQAADEVSLKVRQIQEFALDFFDRFGIGLTFTDEGVDALLEKAWQAGRSVRSVCEDLSKDFKYGFELVREKTGLNRFIITPEAVTDPERYIHNLLQAHFRNKGGEREGEGG